MKENKPFIVLGIIAVILISLVAFFGSRKSEPFKTGSTVGGNEYNSTTTGGTFAGAPLYKVLKTGYGSLGSVVVTNSTAGAINLYDGTSTSALLRTLPGTTTLAVIGASVAAGTYTFDTVFSTGLIVEYPTGLSASSTITWR